MKKAWTYLLLAIAMLAIGRPTLAAGGTLIKGESFSSVYFLDSDERRYVFPNDRVFLSWYGDFSGVRTVTDHELASYPIGGNVTYRPGKKLVKVTTDPKVYAVDRNGTLRWLASEEVAAALYGANWATKVDDVPDIFFVNYRVGLPIASPASFDMVALAAEVHTISDDKAVSVNLPVIGTSAPVVSSPTTQTEPTNSEPVTPVVVVTPTTPTVTTVQAVPAFVGEPTIVSTFTSGASTHAPYWTMNLRVSFENSSGFTTKCTSTTGDPIGFTQVSPDTLRFSLPDNGLQWGGHYSCTFDLKQSGGIIKNFSFSPPSALVVQSENPSYNYQRIKFTNTTDQEISVNKLKFVIYDVDTGPANPPGEYSIKVTDQNESVVFSKKVLDAGISCFLECPVEIEFPSKIIGAGTMEWKATLSPLMRGLMLDGIKIDSDAAIIGANKL